MPHDLLLFATWKTWYNRHMIDEQIAEELVRMLPGLARQESCWIVELAVIPDHVHAVIHTTAKPDIPKLLQRLKGASSRMVNRGRPPRRHLRWQPGYHITSLSRYNLHYVQAYLNRQAEKHGYAWQKRYTIPAKPVDERSASAGRASRQARPSGRA